jgi:phosphohistidine phosphatase SixA
MTKNVLLIRHARALDRKLWNDKGKSDKTRPLTTDGALEFFQVACAIKLLYPQIRLILTSELTRSLETARLLHPLYPYCTLKDTALLNHPGALDLESILKTVPRKFNWIALIGHEPEFGTLLSTLGEGELGMKKGGVAHLQIKNKLVKLRALWQPRELSVLGYLFQEDHSFQKERPQ